MCSCISAIRCVGMSENGCLSLSRRTDIGFTPLPSSGRSATPQASPSAARCGASPFPPRCSPAAPYVAIQRPSERNRYSRMSGANCRDPTIRTKFKMFRSLIWSRSTGMSKSMGVNSQIRSQKKDPKKPLSKAVETSQEPQNSSRQDTLTLH